MFCMETSFRNYHVLNLIRWFPSKLLPLWIPFLDINDKWFVLRLKKKKERNLEVYRKRNTVETIEAARKRYHERRLERKMAGRPI